MEEFMARDLRLSPESRRVASEIFRAAADAPQSFDDFARQFAQAFRHQPQILDFMLDILMRLSVADGNLSSAEAQLIRSAVFIFGFDEAYYQKLQARHFQTANRHYAVLGCSPADSNEKVKQRYRELVKEFHPDRIASKGLPEEFTRFAEEKFREIQEAYEAIRKERRL